MRGSITSNISMEINPRIPFYNHNKKPLCYLNILKGTNYVDVAFVQGIYLQDNFPILKDGNKRKQVRSIQIKSLEDVDESMFVNLLKEAATSLDKNKKAWHL